MPGIVRLIHPAPALTVVALSVALGAILAGQAGLDPFSARLALTTLAIASSQVLTGALNDWADRNRDALVQPAKPIPAGLVTGRTALALAGAGAIVQVAASVPLGWLPLLLGAIAAGSAVAYNLWLSRTPFSVVPYLVSFGILPIWIASGIGVPIERVAAAPLLIGPFAAATHLANTLRDFDADGVAGSRNLAQVLGRRVTHGAAVLGALGVGISVGIVLVSGGRAPVAALVVGAVGVAAVVVGAAAPRWLWGGILLAAACWTISWALGTG